MKEREIRAVCFSARGEKLGQKIVPGHVTRIRAGGRGTITGPGMGDARKEVELSHLSGKQEEAADALCAGRQEESPGGRGESASPLTEWTRDGFREADALIFIGACGIAVRAIAPFVKNKLADPAVLVVDEEGSFVISLLSGHLGGANDLAKEVAGSIGAIPVITTATDRRRTFSVDSWAKENGFGIVNPEAVRTISAAVLDGDEIVLSVRPGKGDVLRLIPKTLALGVGCRKGTDFEHLKECLKSFCIRHAIEPAAIACIASIDLKAKEPALRALAREMKIPLRTYSAEKLQYTEGVFSSSDFVLQTTGTDNVCERAAVCAGGGELLCQKEVYEGVTFALARMADVCSWQWAQESEADGDDVQ